MYSTGYTQALAPITTDHALRMWCLWNIDYDYVLFHLDKHVLSVSLLGFSLTCPVLYPTIRRLPFLNLSANLAEQFPSEFRQNLGRRLKNSQPWKSDRRFWEIWRKLLGQILRHQIKIRKVCLLECSIRCWTLIRDTTTHALFDFCSYHNRKHPVLPGHTGFRVYRV